MAGEEAAVETEKRMQRICMITKIEKILNTVKNWG